MIILDIFVSKEESARKASEMMKIAKIFGMYNRKSSLELPQEAQTKKIRKRIAAIKIPAFFKTAPED